jgi:FkbM family methyltransferase
MSISGLAFRTTDQGVNMEIKRRIKRRLNTVLRPMGYEIQRSQDSLSLPAVLRRLRERGVTLGGVIDIGASDGRWTRELLPFFPEAQYLLVDANPVHRQALEAFCARGSNLRFEIVAAADLPGEVYFDDSHAFIGIARHLPGEPELVRLPATTVDLLVRKHALPGPYLLKLDTHGFEGPILEGAAGCIAQCNLIFIESYNFDLGPETMRFPALCERLRALGFRPVDLVEPIHRPRDGALWQFDLVFEPQGTLMEMDEARDLYELFGMRRVRGQRDPRIDPLSPEELRRRIGQE